MMKTQFIHIETYSVSGGKNKRSARSVLAEATRQPGHCPHVENPRQPKPCHGFNMDSLINELDSVLANCKDVRGRKLRANTQVLLAGVASFPHTIPEIKADTQLREQFNRWKVKTIAFLKEQYAEQFRGALVHLDEEYPHIHFYATAKPSEHWIEQGNDSILRAGYTLDEIHPGRKAAASIQYSKSNGRERQAAYREAMSAFQDDYQDALDGVGLKRISKQPRRRVSRDEWRQGIHELPPASPYPSRQPKPVHTYSKHLA